MQGTRRSCTGEPARPSRDVQDNLVNGSIIETRACIVRSDPSAVSAGAQTRDAPKNPRERTTPVQSEGSLRGLHRRRHGERRPHTGRVLSALFQQGRALCRGGKVVSMPRSTEALAAPVAHWRQATQSTRRGRLLLSRPLRRLRDLLPHDRPAVRCHARQQGGQDRLPRGPGTAHRYLPVRSERAGTA